MAAWVLDNWAEAIGHFVKVMPTEYRLALERIEREASRSAVSNESVIYQAP